MRFYTTLLALSGILVAALPEPAAKTIERNGILYQVHEDLDLGIRMEYVANSGVCETTPGVDQYTGYLTVGPNQHMFFWFFEARNNPETAPFSTWFNGGPGCSSMIGLFQENGPCQFYNGSSTPSINPYSFNEYANMLYVDQPITVGFSYGTNDVDSTVGAAPPVWDLLQGFFKKFPKYQSRDFAVFTESYGGHYGPEFASYIEGQNQQIAAGTLNAEKINLIALGINNGYYDSIIQQAAYIEYSLHNPYRQLINESQAAQYRNAYQTKCKPLLEQCTSISSEAQTPECAASDASCLEYVEGPISDAANFDVYDVREPRKDPYPPKTYIKYLNQPAIQKKIGVNKKFQYCNDNVNEEFTSFGDTSRSFLPTLSQVVQSGIQVLVWHGDADWICNYKGGFTVVQNVEFPGQTTFRAAKLKSYTVNGVAHGLYKTQDNLSWLRVYKAGHEVPYYQPATALQVFKQTMMQKAITPT